MSNIKPADISSSINGSLDRSPSKSRLALFQDAKKSIVDSRKRLRM